MLRAEIYADFASLRKLTIRLNIKSPHIVIMLVEFYEEGYNKSCEKEVFRKSNMLFTGKEIKTGSAGTKRGK